MASIWCSPRKYHGVYQKYNKSDNGCGGSIVGSWSAVTLITQNSGFQVTISCSTAVTFWSCPLLSRSGAGSHAAALWRCPPQRSPAETSKTHCQLCLCHVAFPYVKKKSDKSLIWLLWMQLFCMALRLLCSALLAALLLTGENSRRQMVLTKLANFLMVLV